MAEPRKPETSNVDDWKKLPDKPGTYLLSRIYMALRNDPEVNQEPVYGTALKKAIRDYKAACDRRQVQDTLETRQLWQTSWMRLVDALNTTPYLIPFRYDDDRPGMEDKALHLTAASAHMINRDAIVAHCGKLTGFQMMPLVCGCGEGGRPNPITEWWDISRFSHSAGYSFAMNNGGHGMMRCFTRGGGGSEYFGVYTDIDYVLKGFPNTPCPHIAVFSVGDVLNMIRQQPGLAGLLINPDTETHCFLSRKQLGIP